MVIHHFGSFVDEPYISYVGGKLNVFNEVDVDKYQSLKYCVC